MNARWCAVAVLGVLVAPGAARADMGTPGFKFRELRVVIDNLGGHPDHAFYLAPVEWLTPGKPAFGPWRPERPAPVVLGEEVRPGYAARWAHEWVLVSLPRGRAEREDVTWAALAAGAPGAWHSNRVHLAQPASVPIFNPSDYEVRHFRIDLAGDRLTLTPGAVESHADGFASWLPALLLTAAVVGAGLWVARRLTRPARANPS